IGWRRPLVSGDWPGAFSRALEAETPGLTALYAAGPVGSQAPRVPGGEEGDDLEKAGRLGRAVADLARGLSTGGGWERAPGFGLRTVEVALPPTVFRLA